MFLKNTKSINATIFLAAASLFVIFAFPVSAQITGLTTRSLSEIITGVINWLLSIASGLAILFIIIGGIYYITAGGDEQRMSTGKKIITYSVVGLVFIIISYSIVVTVNKIIAG